MGKSRPREVNERREIEHRIDRLDRAIKTGKIEKSKTFKDLNVANKKLDDRILFLNNRKIEIEKQLEEAKAQKLHVQEQRKQLGYEHEIEITEHALLRYLERYRNVDIEEIWNEILKLPKKDVTKYGNTIVTVYPDDSDVVDLDN